ncbi:hypothetical protein GGR44_001113 [Sphingobium fontiphilum]|uniref:Uncharacterized protein n=1 Tax=Sphingobium fontiphilum TaxID=944425 RepID=A0A7W6GMQ8_9SPHN|nr:hypothetical protein [Sphingobium fontiphilum]
MESEPVQFPGNVPGDIAIHFSDEAQGDVELRFLLPAGAGHAVHEGQKLLECFWRWLDADKEPVHCKRIADCGREHEFEARFRLKKDPGDPIIGATARGFAA